MWDGDSPSPKHSWQAHDEGLGDAALHPHGGRLATASADRTVKVWDVKTGNELLTFARHSFPVQCVAFDSTGETIASGASSGNVNYELKLWNDDGTLLACATQLGAVRIYDARGIADGLRLAGHAAPIESYGFAPDGRLVSRDSEKTLFEWTLPTGEHATPDDSLDPDPLPAESPDGQWAVEVDHRDTTILHAIRRPQGLAAYNPWQEAVAWHQRRAPTWHAEDAVAAEKRGDWYAAAFHLARLKRLKPDDEKPSARLEKALEELKSRNLATPPESAENSNTAE